LNFSLPQWGLVLGFWVFAVGIFAQRPGENPKKARSGQSVPKWRSHFGFSTVEAKPDTLLGPAAIWRLRLLLLVT
jgi:hypothetical protein